MKAATMFDAHTNPSRIALAEPSLEMEGFERDVRAFEEPGTVRIVRTADEANELSHDWEKLGALSGRPMQGFAWSRACAAIFAMQQELHLIVIGTPSRVAAIAPLVRQHDRGGRLALLGVDELDEPMEFLFAEPSALASLAGAVAGAGSSLFLKRVPAESPIVPALRQAYRWRGVVICQPVAGSPWLPLDAGWLQPELQLTPGRRSALIRARRIAEETGPVRYEVLSPSPAELGPLLNEAFLVERSGRKGRAGAARAREETREIFYRRYAALAAEQGTLRLCFLRVGGRAAAMQLAVECGERFWLLAIGHDEAFARCSPAALLVLETVRYAASQGLRSYEFLGPCEPWTRMWTSLVRPCVSVRAYPANGSGMATLAADVAAVARRRFGHAL